MSLSLPEAVATYFAISNGADIANVKHCFTPDAVVIDESKTHRGLEAIQAWQRDVQNAFEYTVEPIRVAEDGARLTVTSHVAGNFPGSPVQLSHAFTLLDGKIASLEIV